MTTLRTNFVQDEPGHPASHNDVNAAVNTHTVDTANPHSTTLAKISGAIDSVVTLAGTLVQWVRVNIPAAAGGEDTATWPDRLVFFYNGTRTGHFNEYGELRARPHNTTAVALRTQGALTGHAGDIFQVTSYDNLTVYFGASPTSVHATVPITGPNLPPSILVLNAAEAVPNGTPAGSIVCRRP
jgi:hypothetical protein